VQFLDGKVVDFRRAIVKAASLAAFSFRKYGGETGIRTLDTLSRIHAFQACAFSHSAISPARLARLEAGHSKARGIPILSDAAGFVAATASDQD
jgi:hypothetical protein